MLTKVRSRLAQEEGFTLIELLVVILIIGILAAVAIPTFLSQKNKATDSNAQSNLKNAQTVVESFANGNGGTYPGSGSATLVTIPNTSGLSQDSDATALGTGSGQVWFSGGGTQSDSYALCAEGSDNTVDHLWWIVVTNGTTTYYETTGSGSGCSGATVPTSGGQTSGFPSITTS